MYIIDDTYFTGEISLPNLPVHQKQPIINIKREVQECTEISKKLMLKASSIEADAYSLSGGNQQKVVISKWIMSMPKLLILDFIISSSVGTHFGAFL